MDNSDECDKGTNDPEENLDYLRCKISHIRVKYTESCVKHLAKGMEKEEDALKYARVQPYKKYNIKCPTMPTYIEKELQDSLAKMHNQNEMEATVENLLVKSREVQKTLKMIEQNQSMNAKLMKTNYD